MQLYEEMKTLATMNRLVLLLGFVSIVLISTAFYIYVYHREDYVQLILAFLVIGAFWYFTRYLRARIETKGNRED